MGKWPILSTHLNFLTLITEIITKRFPNMAATMMNIIIDALNIVIIISIHSSFILSSILELKFLLLLLKSVVPLINNGNSVVTDKS